jgi:lysophospholipase L1-like esterase
MALISNSPRTLVIAIAVITAAILLVTTAVLPQTISTITPEPRQSVFWLNRFDEINRRIEQGSIDLLFVGDSITHFWEGTIYPKDSEPHGTAGQVVWDEYYSQRNAANIGIGGDKIEHILWRLDHGNIDGISPKLIVLLAGTNNAEDNTAAEIADGIVAIIDKLQLKLPDSKILLLSIFPRGEHPNDLRTILANASETAAARIADRDKVLYMDIAANFLSNDGILSPDIMPDALHPNEQGYRIWAESIEPIVSELF